MIKYIVSLDNPNKHLINICLVINQNLGKNQQFWLPDWIPGSYMIRDFSKNIVTLHAECQGKEVKIKKIDKSTWQLDEEVSELKLIYQVYAWDLSVRSAHFDDCHCFFNGTSTFIALKGFESSQHLVEIKPPKQQNNLIWKVATSMAEVSTDKNGYGTYQSECYAELIDHPFEVANFIETEFAVNDVVHRLIFAEAPNNIDVKRVTRDVQTICQYECDFFADEKPPFNSFLFMTFVQKKGFGGLEHMASTALHCSHNDLPKIDDDPDVKSLDYQRFLSLCCHEYFHCWNVKRIKPAVFKPYQLQTEVNTELLWFFEGITSYYDELFLIRCGVISQEEYLAMLAKNITRYIRGTGRLKQSVTESSFDAWTKFYQQDENASNAIVSYYVKGGLVAMCLDFEIRKLTHHTKSLDDLMRLVWKEYGCRGNSATGKGLKDKDIQRIAEVLVGDSMGDFFTKHLYSTQELELNKLFSSLNISCSLFSQEKQLDTGGFIKKSKVGKQLSSLSISHKNHNLGAEIMTVLEGGTAEICGLSNKDIIVAINDYRVTSQDLDNTINGFPLKSKIKISYFRREQLQHKECYLKASAKNTCYLSFMNKNEDDLLNENSLLKDWLKL